MMKSTHLEPQSDLLKPAAAADESPAEDAVVSYADYEAWEFLHFISSHLSSLETRAAIIMPAQVAALIALWTQLYTFEEDLPYALAWAAWACLLLGLVGAAWLIMPNRLKGTSLLGHGLDARPEADRAQIVKELSAIVQQRVRRLHVGLIVSIGLIVLAVAMVVVAYVVDKAFYAP